MASFQDRVIGAIRINPQTFEEVEHDQSATGQAAIVVLATAISGGLGTGYFTGMIAGAISGMIGWAVGAFVLLIVGTKLLPGKNTEADYGQMLRTMGFAQAIGIFGILGLIPILGYLIKFVIWVWILVAMVIAVRQALDYEDTMRAVLVCVVAWAIMFVVVLIATAVGIGSAAVGSQLF
jgi:hypothetical protein